jgi:hypothetical protein
MTTKHTPGPWAVRPDKRGPCIVGMDPDYPGLPRYVGILDSAWDDKEANARLIASAPELLEAARMGLQALAILESNGLDTEQDEKDKAFIQQAIAKAEGRE